MASIATHHAGARRPSDKNTARKKTKPVNKEIRRRVQQVFVQNLVLLGYEDFDVHGGKTRGKKKLDVGMFVRPNPTDFYRIVYFLLFKLRKNYIKETFSKCWPVRDSKQTREFRKLAMIEIKKLSASNAIPTNLVQPSLFTSPKGFRAEKLIWLLSTYTLEKSLAREAPAAYHSLNFPEIKDASSFVNDAEYSAHLRDVLKAMRAQRAYRAEEFRKKAAEVINTQHMFGDYAVNLTGKLREAERQSAVLRRKQNEFPDAESGVIPQLDDIDYSDLVNPDAECFWKDLKEVMDGMNDEDFVKNVNEAATRISSSLENLPDHQLEANKIMESPNFNLNETLESAVDQIRNLTLEFNGLDSSALSTTNVGNLADHEAIPLMGGDKFLSNIKATVEKLEEMRDKTMGENGSIEREGDTLQGRKINENKAVPITNVANCPTPSKIPNQATQRNSDANGAILSTEMQKEEPHVYGSNGIDLQGIQETLATLRGQKKANQNKTANGSSGLVKTVLDKKLHVKSEEQITTNPNEIQSGESRYAKTPDITLARKLGTSTKPTLEDDEFLTPSMLKRIVDNENLVTKARNGDKTNVSSKQSLVGQQKDKSASLKSHNNNNPNVQQEGSKAKLASVEQKRLLVKLLTPTKRHFAPPSPLRTELIKLVSALYKHKSIDEKTRGDLKNRIIQCKSLRSLQQVHKEISSMFDDASFVTPPAITKK